MNSNEPDDNQAESTSEAEEVIVVHGKEDVDIRARHEEGDDPEDLNQEEKTLHEHNAMGTEIEEEEDDS